MNAVIIICTRPESSRLPGKVFMPVAGVCAIDHILTRLRGCGIPVILAVPDDCHDYDRTVESYRAFGDIALDIFRGDSQSPLHRMEACVRSLPSPEWIIRITHDDILIDQKTMLDLLRTCMLDPTCGYGISPSIVDGAGVEVIHTDNLFDAAKNREEPTEFISYFVKGSHYPGIQIFEPRESICRPYRLTMDYYEDWLVLDTVLSRIGPFAPLDEVCRYLDEHSHVMSWNRQPTVSFYTCVKNGEKYLRSAMQSVLNTQNVDFEYIVVDDGSTDDTSVIISEFGTDPRVRFFKNNASLGLASASNIAVNKARGKYIMRVDADDILLPHAASTLLRVIEEGGGAAVYARYHETNSEAEVIEPNVDPRKAHHAGCALFDHKLLNEIRFTDGLRHFDGADLHKRMIEKNMPISYVSQPLWLYRRHDKNLSNSDPAERSRVRSEIGLGMATATSLKVEPGWRPIPIPPPLPAA